MKKRFGLKPWRNVSSGHRSDSEEQFKEQGGGTATRTHFPPLPPNEDFLEAPRKLRRKQEEAGLDTGFFLKRL